MIKSEACPSFMLNFSGHNRLLSSRCSINSFFRPAPTSQRNVPRQAFQKLKSEHHHSIPEPTVHIFGLRWKPHASPASEPRRPFAHKFAWPPVFAIHVAFNMQCNFPKPCNIVFNATHHASFACDLWPRDPIMQVQQTLYICFPLQATVDVLAHMSFKESEQC